MRAHAVEAVVEALRKGWDTYLAALIEPDAVSAIKLTLIAAAVSVPLNLVFGVAAARDDLAIDLHRHPALGEVFAARRGAGATLNGAPIRPAARAMPVMTGLGISRRSSPHIGDENDAVATGSPFSSADSPMQPPIEWASRCHGRGRSSACAATTISTTSD